MASHGDESSHNSVGGRWGEQDDREHRRGRHHHRHDDHKRFSMHRFLQMGLKPLVGGESSEDAGNWLRRMEVCFREFRCTEEQRMETLDFLVEGRARKWWDSTSTPFIAARGVATLDEFRTAFHNLYFPPDLRQAKASELLCLRQGSMSIDEYQLKFFELLPYCPQISNSTEAKYNLFLQGLNPEIHDRVVVGDDMTYEGLYFKKSGSTSSLGSGEVMRFGRKNQGPCKHCGGNHPSNWCRKTSGCSRDHRDSRHGSNLKPRASSQLFSLRHDQAVDENEKVIAGTLLLFDIPAFALIDTSASHSFILARFVKNYKLHYISLDTVVFVSTPTGKFVSAKRLVLGCPLEFEGNVLMVNLMILAMEDFDCIRGIDVLTTYRTSVDCYQRLVRFIRLVETVGSSTMRFQDFLQCAKLSLT
ncbi:uncharacterized protein [Henckelia pumila]|uniref:uncharacterized protein n=1 Tax=Henckelia pumila TaxID=405737 RepID=UPI003C6E4BDC